MGIGRYNTKAHWSLVLGAVSVLLGLLFLSQLLLVVPTFGLAAIVSGLLGLKDIKRDASLGKRWIAITGISLGILSLILSFILLFGLLRHFAELYREN